MKTTANQWLAGRAGAPGLLGCGITGPEDVWICQCPDETACSSGKLQQILQQVAAANELLAVDGQLPPAHTWVFAEGKIRSVRRPDGWNLVIVVRADAAAAQSLEVLAAEFTALQPGN